LRVLISFLEKAKCWIGIRSVYLFVRNEHCYFQGKGRSGEKRNARAREMVGLFHDMAFRSEVVSHTVLTPILRGKKGYPIKGSLLDRQVWNVF
jgi:hypothetical protein